MEVDQSLLPALRELEESLAKKAKEFDPIVKSGRTHLMDATPIRLGQEFSGYQSQIDHGIRRVSAARAALAELAIGGTAVGTGINAHPDLPGRVVEKVSAATNTKFRVAENHFEAQAARDALVEASGAIRTVAISMMKIANDLRWLGSGPHTGLRELNLPAVQPGSSIMPGKVNPVIPEAVMQVGVTVIGNDVAIAVANTHSNLDLSTMMPVMSQRIQQNVELLANVARVFAHKCIDGITANVDVLKPVGDKRGITRVSAVVVSGPRPASPRLRGGIPGRGRFLIGLAGRSKLSPAFVRPPAPWKGGSLL